MALWDSPTQTFDEPSVSFGYGGVVLPLLQDGDQFPVAFHTRVVRPLMVGKHPLGEVRIAMFTHGSCGGLDPIPDHALLPIPARWKILRNC